MVIERDSCSDCLDGPFSHMFVVKIVMFDRKDENKEKKRPRMADFLKFVSCRRSICDYRCAALGSNPD